MEEIKVKEVKYIDKNKAQSLIISALYFPKKDFHFLLARYLNPEYALFYQPDDEKSKDNIKRI
jgi:hypothetical protein